MEKILILTIFWLTWLFPTCRAELAERCTKGTYFSASKDNPGTGECQSCNSKCSATWCIGPDPEDCIQCADPN